LVRAMSQQHCVILSRVAMFTLRLPYYCFILCATNEFHISQALKIESNESSPGTKGTSADLIAKMTDTQTLARAIVKEEAERISKALLAKYAGSNGINASELATVWTKSFRFTADKTWDVFPEDATTFVKTGDIRQMWLRDSAVQMMGYIPLAAVHKVGNKPVRDVLESAMRRQVNFILDDPYASAFEKTHGPGEDEGPNKGACPRTANCENCRGPAGPPCGQYTYQMDYKLDALLFPILLHYRYWKDTGSTNHISQDFGRALLKIYDLMRIEQYHATRSKYNYKGSHQEPHSHVKEGIGLVWSYARPSDDPTTYGYNIPQNLMATVTLQDAAEMAKGPLQDIALANKLTTLAGEVSAGISKYGIVNTSDGKHIYAFEVDGFGHSIKMDDANMPNLLWLPYLSKRLGSTQLYKDTRTFVLSAQDPSFFRSKFVGLGSEHESHGLRNVYGGPECAHSCIWPLGLIMQGMTAQSNPERLNLMSELLSTTGGTNLLHEGFSSDNPKEYNRDWFGWAEALFAE